VSGRRPGTPRDGVVPKLLLIMLSRRALPFPVPRVPPLLTARTESGAGTQAQPVRLRLLYRRVPGLGHVCMTRCVHVRLRERAGGQQRSRPHAARTNHAHMHAHTHTGVALLSSIALIFTAILVLSSSSSKDERRGESRGFGFGDVMLARVCFHTFQIILL